MTPRDRKEVSGMAEEVVDMLVGIRRILLDAHEDEMFRMTAPAVDSMVALLDRLVKE